MHHAIPHQKGKDCRTFDEDFCIIEAEQIEKFAMFLWVLDHAQHARQRLT